MQRFYQTSIFVFSCWALSLSLFLSVVFSLSLSLCLSFSLSLSFSLFLFFFVLSLSLSCSLSLLFSLSLFFFFPSLSLPLINAWVCACCLRWHEPSATLSNRCWLVVSPFEWLRSSAPPFPWTKIQTQAQQSDVRREARRYKDGQAHERTLDGHGYELAREIVRERR